MGINTSTPKSTFDIQASSIANYPDGVIAPRVTADVLKSKESAYGTDQNGAMVYVTAPLTTTTGAIKTLGITNIGVYIYEANTLNSASQPGLWVKMAPNTVADGAYAARMSGNLNLLNLSVTLLGSSFGSIPLQNTTTTTPNYTTSIPSSSIVNNTYVVPSTGLYHIDFSYRTGQGIKAELLGSNRPGLAILRTASGNTVAASDMIDYRQFGGIQLLDLLGISVANISITQGQISHIYQFNAGDVIRLGVISGGVSLSLISDTSAEISIYKIR